MYHLLVSANDEEWNGEPFILEIGRCVREYTDKEITEKYGELTTSQINEIRRFPCIFAYETGCKKDPKFGLIRDITKRKGKIKIEYEIVKLDNFLTHKDILNMLFELDISDWEMNRTHWAIKDVNLAKELAAKGIHLPRWARTESKSVDITKHKFDVALSFPGEIREYVESIAIELEREIGPDSYFYDDNYKAQLARPSLDSLLQDIYRHRSKLIVVFLCEKYQEKEWCGIEFRAVQEIIKKREHEKVMFIKMDEGKVDGVFSTDGYIDGRRHTPAEVARFIRERVTLLS
ncbi:MAG: toll/interleukin-1 receptor domain-containing protein [Candidatus Helarchaeota archaeon]